MRGLSRRLNRARKSVGKYFAPARSVIARQGLKYDVVTTLGVRGSIPRSMEGDEHAVTVVGWELRVVVQRHRVRRPMGRKRRDRGGLGRAPTHFLASIAAVLGSENQFALDCVVVALRPAVVAAPSQQQQLFGGLRGLLIGFVAFRPIRMQLVASVLRDKDVVGGIDREPLRIAYTGGEAFGWREHLVPHIRVVAPDAAARIELRARLDSRRVRGAI